MSIQIQIFPEKPRLSVNARTLQGSGSHVITIRADDAQYIDIFFPGNGVSRVKIDAIVDAFNATYDEKVPE